MFVGGDGNVIVELALLAEGRRAPGSLATAILT
jgi:hypothetical protein